MKNLLLIAGGGGNRSAYQSGVIKALIEKYELTSPKDIVATSGGAADFIYYVSGQSLIEKSIWTSLISSRKFIHLKNIFSKKPIMNLDFLIHLLKTKFPLKIDNFRNSKTKIHISVTNSRTREIEYFTNKDPIDPYLLLKAACALPFLYGRKVKINKEKYLDGGIIESIGLRKAIELKSENVLIILTTPWQHLISPSKFYVLRERFFLKNKDALSSKQMKDNLNTLREISKNLFILEPKSPLFSSISNTTSKIEQEIEQGYQETIEDVGLERFFKKLNH